MYKQTKEKRQEVWKATKRQCVYNIKEQAAKLAGYDDKK